MRTGLRRRRFVARDVDLGVGNEVRLGSERLWLHILLVDLLLPVFLLAHDHVLLPILFQWSPLPEVPRAVLHDAVDLVGKVAQRHGVDARRLDGGVHSHRRRRRRIELCGAEDGEEGRIVGVEGREGRVGRGVFVERGPRRGGRGQTREGIGGDVEEARRERSRVGSKRRNRVKRVEVGKTRRESSLAVVRQTQPARPACERRLALRGSSFINRREGRKAVAVAPRVPASRSRLARVYPTEPRRE